MKYLVFLFLIPLVRSAVAASSVADCIAKCGVAKGGKVCATDQVLYDDSCRAACASADNFVLVTCGNSTDAQCKTNCAAQLSYMKCQISAKIQDQRDIAVAKVGVRCGSTGRLFSSLRVAQCNYPTITEEFSCGTLGLSQVNCNTKCAMLPTARLFCAKQASSPVCATDSMIYRNTCEMNFMMSKVADGFGSQEVASSQACQDYVMLHYGVITGLPPKPRKGA